MMDTLDSLTAERDEARVWIRILEDAWRNASAEVIRQRGKLAQVRDALAERSDADMFAERLRRIVGTYPACAGCSEPERCGVTRGNECPGWGGVSR